MTLKRRKVSLIGVLLAVSLLLLGLTIYTPQQATVLSLSRIYVNPEGGYEENNEYKGAYWIILMTADLNDKIAGFKFASDDEGVYIEDSSGKHYIAESDRAVEEGLLDIEATLEIKIDPQQPYYKRPMEIRSALVHPETFGTYQHKVNLWSFGESEDKVAALYSGHWEWLEPSVWEKYTPFTVSVSKDGESAGVAQINTEGGSRFAEVDTGEGKIRITNLGYLSGTWGEPQFGNIIYFSDSEIYESTPYARNLIEYDSGQQTYVSGVVYRVTESIAYSVYWFGDMRWVDNDRPCAVNGIGGWYGDERGGWIGADDFWHVIRKPVRACIMDKSSLPLEKRPLMSLVEYLRYRNVRKINPNVWGEGAFKRADNNLQVDMPFNALGVGSPVFTIMIPTELVDTFIWQPPMSNVQITDLSISDTIQDRATASVTLKQESTVTSTADVVITFNPSDAPLSAIPSSFSVSMAPNEIRTETFELINTGTETERDVDVIVTVYNQLGMTSQELKKVTLLPKTGVATVLTVYTEDAVTKKRLSGIYVSVAWDSQSQGGYTNAGSYTFELGTISGQVKLRAEETDEYEDAVTYVNLVVGSNTATLSLEPKGQNGDADYTWLVILLIAIALIAVAFSQRRRLKRWTQ